MDWKKESIADLRAYRSRKESLTSIPENAYALKMLYQSAKVSNTDATPVNGGGNRIEDSMLNNITKRERLKYTYKGVKPLVKLVERGLAGLTDDEQKILARFYIEPYKGGLDDLMEELHVEKTKLYEMKNKALYKFTICMYGVTEY